MPTAESSVITNDDPPMLVLADARDALRVLQGSVWTWVALVVVLIVMAGALLWVRSRFLEHSGPAAGGDEMLSLVRNLNREGDLTDDEYRSIKGRLLEQDDRETSATSPPPSEEEDAGTTEATSAASPTQNSD